MDETADAMKEILAERVLKFTHPSEIEEAKKRSRQRFSNVCNFPLKLIFTPLKRHKRVANTLAVMLNMHFGPLHVALQVGSVFDRSLVSPSLLPYKDQLGYTALLQVGGVYCETQIQDEKSGTGFEFL